MGLDLARTDARDTSATVSDAFVWAAIVVIGPDNKRLVLKRVD